ncbi:MAG: YncE family protein [Bradymonadaceae bacterium]
MKSRVISALVGGLIVLTGCTGQFEEPLPPRDKIYYPIGLEMHPNGRYLYTVNSNFDARYRADQGGTVSVIDTETMQIVRDGSPNIPSFGAFLKLNADATKAYVTTRHNNEVIALDVSADGRTLSCARGTAAPSANTTNCAVRRVPDEREGALVGNDPFGIDVTTIMRTDPESGEETPVDVVNLSYLRGNQVTAMTFPGQTISGATMRSASLIAGGNQVVRRPGSLDFYVAGRSTNVVAIYQPFINDAGRVEAIVRRGAIELSRAVEAVDARGLTFSEDGKWLYVATRRPAALHVVAIDRTEGLRHEVVDTISLRRRPTDVVLHTTALGRELVYVPSYQEGTIEVVDPMARAIVDVIEVGPAPYSMVIDRGEGRCEAPGQMCRAYISLFDDTGTRGVSCDEVPDQGCGAIAVIDLDPDSPRYHQVIKKIR